MSVGSRSRKMLDAGIGMPDRIRVDLVSNLVAFVN